MSFIKTRQILATAGNKWHRVRFFTNFRLRLRIQVRKNAESCQSRLRHSGSVATSAVIVTNHTKQINPVSVLHSQARETYYSLGAVVHWLVSKPDSHEAEKNWVRLVSKFDLSDKAIDRLGVGEARESVEEDKAAYRRLLAFLQIRT